MMTANHTSKIHRRRMMLTAALGLALAGLARTAHAQDPVTLTIIDHATGQPMPVWRHNGQLYIAGRPGAEYCLRVRNNTGRRVEAVLSVDGVNIQTGETASTGQDGYVFSPYQSYDQCGWRKSLTEVAAFNFTALPNSYAARTGRPGNVGVIGMAVFYEKPLPPLPSPPPPPPAAARRPSSTPGSDTSNTVSEVVATGSYIRGAPEDASIPVEVTTRADVENSGEPALSALAGQRGSGRTAAPAPRPAPQEKIGTGHGALEYSSVVLVSFNRETISPQFSQQIQYDTEANLVAQGLIPRRPVPPPQPKAFPLDPPAPRFVPDPPR